MISRLLSKLLGILPNEWPRVRATWLVSAITRTGYIVGWTTITAIFVYKRGIENLPFLYICYAAATILGTFIYSLFTHRLSNEINIVISIICGGLCLFLTNYFNPSSQILFFALAIAAAGIFFSQLAIHVSIFIEESFSPLESQRTFPIVESSETIGGIIGGLIVVSLVRLTTPHNLLYIWVILTLLIIPILFIYNKNKRIVPIFADIEEVKENSLKKVLNGLQEIKRIPFLKGLFLIVMLHWVFISLLDFQFTKSLDQSILEKKEKTLVINEISDSIHASALQTQLNPPKLSVNAVKKELTREEAYLKKLTEGLGKLHILFSLSALLIQLFLSSKLIKKLGIIGSLMLHPLVALINIFGLTIRFELVTAIVSKTGAEITGAVFKNAYHTSYYAISKHKRHQAKEFMEGIGKPLGTIIGTISLLILIKLYNYTALTLSINVSMIFILVLMMIVLLAMQKKYTYVSKEQLLKEGDHPERFHAIEILSQKGHKNSGEILTSIISSSTETDRIKIKALEALGIILDTETIPDIIELLLTGKKEIKLAALQTLSKFKNLDKHFLSQAVSHYRIIDALKKLFKEGSSPEIKSEIVKIFAKLNQKDLIPFIFESIEKTSGNVRASCINALQSFDDVSAAYSVKKYQNDECDSVKIATISLLWKFHKTRDQVRKKIEKLRKSEKIEDIVLAIKIIGELDIKKYIPFLREQSESKNHSLKNAAMLSLARMAENDAFSNILKSKIKNISCKDVKKYLAQIPENIRDKIEKDFKKAICEEINLLHKEQGKKNFRELDLKVLKQLKEYYEISGEYEEVYKITNFLEQKNDEDR